LVSPGVDNRISRHRCLRVRGAGSILTPVSGRHVAAVNAAYTCRRLAIRMNTACLSVSKRIAENGIATGHRATPSGRVKAIAFARAHHLSYPSD